jgi:hypothetical protein
MSQETADKPPRPPLKVVDEDGAGMPVASSPPPPASTTSPPVTTGAAVNDEHERDHDRTWLDRVLELGLLNVYGSNGEMSRRVRADVAFAALLIVIQACIDLLAWFLGMKLVFVNGFGPWIGYPLALVFASLFAATIAIFERSVLAADVALKGVWRNPAIWFRIAFVLLASLVTAVPLELFLFNDEIGGVLGRQRGAQVAHARDVLRGNVDVLLKASDDKLDKDLARLEDQFGPLRAYDPPSTSSVSPRIATLEASIAGVTAEMQREEEGSRSGSSGRGRRFRSLQGQLDTLNQQLALLTTTHNDELADLRKEARARAEAGETSYRDAVGALRAGHEKERAALLAQRAAIDELPVDVLAARARVTIDVPDGFSARVRILHDLADKEPTIGWGIQALRLVMVLFGLLVLIQKATFSTETKAYFSAMARAATGDGRLRRLYGGLSRLDGLDERERRAMQNVSRPPDDAG